MMRDRLFGTIRTVLLAILWVLAITIWAPVAVVLWVIHKILSISAAQLKYVLDFVNKES